MPLTSRTAEKIEMAFSLHSGCLKRLSFGASASCARRMSMRPYIPQEFSTKLIDRSSFVIMRNTMPPRDPDEDEDEDDDEEDDTADEPPVVREPDDD